MVVCTGRARRNDSEVTTPPEPPPDPWATPPQQLPPQQLPPQQWGAPPAAPPGAPPQWGQPPQQQPWGQPPSYNPPPGAPPGYPQAAYPPGGYPQGAWGPYGTRPRNGTGTTALVLAIVGLLTFWFGLGILLGIVAFILGMVGRGKAKRGQATNGGTALAGAIVGAFVAVGGVLFFVAILARGGFGDYLSCTRNATSTYERQLCRDELHDRLNR